MCAPHALNQDNQQEFKAPGVCKVGRSADISVGEDLPCGPSHSESPTRNSDGLIVIGQVMFSHSGKPKLFLAGPLKASCRPHLRRRLRPESASMAGSKNVTPLPAGGDSPLASPRGWLPQLLLQFAAVTV